jgi:hypothetical protein
MRNIEAARLCGFDQNSVNHPGILLMAHSAQFFTLDEVNPCCRPAPDNAETVGQSRISGSCKQRAPKIQQPRYRLACCGELIQI